jgi:hypothetical protein
VDNKAWVEAYFIDERENSREGSAAIADFANAEL